MRQERDQGPEHGPLRWEHEAGRVLVRFERGHAPNALVTAIEVDGERVFPSASGAAAAEIECALTLAEGLDALLDCAPPGLGERMLEAAVEALARPLAAQIRAACLPSRAERWARRAESRAGDAA